MVISLDRCKLEIKRFLVLLSLSVLVYAAATVILEWIWIPYFAYIANNNQGSVKWFLFDVVSFGLIEVVGGLYYSIKSIVVGSFLIGVCRSSFNKLEPYALFAAPAIALLIYYFEAKVFFYGKEDPYFGNINHLMVMCISIVSGLLGGWWLISRSSLRSAKIISLSIVSFLIAEVIFVFVMMLNK